MAGASRALTLDLPFAHAHFVGRRAPLWYKLDDDAVTLVGEQLQLDKTRRAPKAATAPGASGQTPATWIKCVVVLAQRDYGARARRLTNDGLGACAIDRASSTEAYLLVYVDEAELARWEASDANGTAAVPADLAPAIDAEAEKAQNDARDVQQRYGAPAGVEGGGETVLTLPVCGVVCTAKARPIDETRSWRSLCATSSCANPSPSGGASEIPRCELSGRSLLVLRRTTSHFVRHALPHVRGLRSHRRWRRRRSWRRG